MKIFVRTQRYKLIYCVFWIFQMLMVEVTGHFSLFFPKLQQLFVMKHASRIISLGFSGTSPWANISSFAQKSCNFSSFKYFII